MPPERIARFEIVSEAGKSGIGTIYKATDPKTGRTVALHTTPVDATAECQARLAPFRQQTKSASVLNSPNIAAVFGLGELEGQFFVVSEWVDGVPLKSKVKEGMSAAELVDLTRQICTALDHAHGKNCVHTRLSPATIVVEWDGTAKIMGFAVAPELEAPGARAEAAPYLSPEQARGEPASPRSNLFTWGAILYELTTQQRPFGEDPGTLRARLCDETPRPPHEVNPKVHPGISQVIMKALAKSPAERYASGAELVADIENYKNLVKTEAAAASVRTPAPGTLRAPTPVPGSVAAPTPVQAPTPPPATLRAPAAPTPAPGSVKAPPPAAVVPHPLPPLPRAQAAPKGGIGQQKLLLVVGGAVILLLIVVVGLLLTRKPSGDAAPPPSLTVRELTPEEQQATSAAGAPATAAKAPGTPAATSRPRAPRPATPAAAPAPPVVRTGELIITSTPEGAQVQIDGQPSGTTPYTATVTAGQHTIVVSKPGHAAVTRIVDVLPGSKATLPATLIELAATLNVSSEPAGANILLNGRDSGKVTPAQLVIGKGSYTVVVRKQGFLDESTTVELQPGGSANYSASLKVMGSAQSIRSSGGIKKIFGGKPQDSAKLTIKTDPKGAQIMINNRMMDKSAPAEFYLEPGNYEIVLTLSGYKPLRKVVAAEKGGRINIEEKLQR